MPPQTPYPTQQSSRPRIPGLLGGAASTQVFPLAYHSLVRLVQILSQAAARRVAARRIGGGRVAAPRRRHRARLLRPHELHICEYRGAIYRGLGGCCETG